MILLYYSVILTFVPLKPYIPTLDINPCAAGAIYIVFQECSAQKQNITKLFEHALRLLANNLIEAYLCFINVYIFVI